MTAPMAPPQQQQVLAVLAPVPPGLTQLEVQAVLVVPHFPGGVVGLPQGLPCRPILAPDILMLFGQLLQQGLVEIPVLQEDGTSKWTQVRPMPMRIKPPPTAGENGHPVVERRILLPGE